MRDAILTSAYLAPVHYYTKLYACKHIYLETNDHYVKQTYRNRCIIASPDGCLPLTIPIERNDCSHTPMRDIRISDHGNWRHLHWNALVSAYENSPFFEYYEDDFRHFYEEKYDFLADFNLAIEETVCNLLGISCEREKPDSYMNAENVLADDFRENIRPKIDYSFDKNFRPMEYYQVFKGKNGFLPNLSIADLLFNMGPESRLVLRGSIVENQ